MKTMKEISLNEYETAEENGTRKEQYAAGATRGGYEYKGKFYFSRGRKFVCVW